MNTARPKGGDDARLVSGLSLLIALSYGLSYGDAFSNQPTYLPSGLRLADPSFLAHDWWLNETVHYHVAFSRLVQLFTISGVPALLLAAVNTLLLATSLVVVYFFIARLVSGRSAFIAWSFVTGIFVLALETRTLSGTYLFSTGLQPSIIASCCFLAAMLWFLDDRHRRSGLILAVGGVFHVNFAIIGVACFGLAQLAAGRPGLTHRLLWQTGPALLVVAANLPVVMALQAGATAEENRAALDIFVHVAVPDHYHPMSYLRDFLPFTAWQALGLLNLRAVPAGPERKRLLALHLSMLAVIAAATLLTTVVFVEPVARAFFFRLNPFAQLIATMLVAVAVARRISRDDEASSLAAPSEACRWRCPIVHAMARFGAVATIAWSAWLSWRPPSELGWILSGTAAFRWGVVVLPLLLVASLRLAGGRPGEWLKRTIRTVTGRMLLAGALIVIAIPNVLTYPDRFNLWSKAPRNSNAAPLYKWAANTPPATLFVTPPDMMDFRLLTQRAIIVDIKALPLEARSLLAWYRRMEDVSGRPGFRQLRQAITGYDQMDAARLDNLVRTYQPDYVVLRDTENARKLGGEIAYSDPWFVVLRLPRVMPGG